MTPIHRPEYVLVETSSQGESWLVCASPVDGDDLLAVYRLGVAYRLRCSLCGCTWRDRYAVGHLERYPPATGRALDLGDSAPLCPVCVDGRAGQPFAVPCWALSSLVAVRLLLRVETPTCGRLSGEARRRRPPEDSDSQSAPLLHLDADLRGHVLAAWDAHQEGRP